MSKRNAKIKHHTRHKVIYLVFRNTLGPLVKRFAGLKCEKIQGPQTPSLIISNHNTNLDPVFVALGFSRHMYFLASEHALRGGIASKILRFMFAPIAFNKVIVDAASVMEMIHRMKNGANVCLFAEGDRSANGLTGPIDLSTAKLAKTCGADLITYRLEGGYFAEPRWAKKMRKGVITGSLVNTYTAEVLKDMSADEVLEAVRRDIYVDAYEIQNKNPQRYKGKDLAENLETALYICPQCKSIGTLKSKGDRFYCSCGLSGIYTETGYLKGDALPFTTITQWDRWQTAQLTDMIKNAGYDPICIDDEQELFEVRPAVEAVFIAKGQMYIDRRIFYCAGMKFPLENITQFSIIGQRRLLVGLKSGSSFEIRCETPRSALKYRDIFRILSGA